MIQLDNKFYIDIDKFQYILRRKELIKSGKRKGKEIFYDEGYFASLERLLSKYKHLQLKNSFPENIVELIYAIRDLENKIEEIGDRLSKELKNNINK